MGDLLITRPEPVAEQFDIVARGLTFLQEARIGHEQRSSEVVGKAHIGEFLRRLIRQTGRVDMRPDHVGVFQQADLNGELKPASRLAQQFRQVDPPPVAVEIAQLVGHHIYGNDAHLIAMTGFQPVGQRRVGLIRTEEELAGKDLGSLIQLRKIVAVLVKEFAHRIHAARRLLEDFDLLAVCEHVGIGMQTHGDIAVACIKAKEGVCDLRARIHHLFNVVLTDGADLKRRIADNFHHLRDEARVICPADIAEIEIIDLGQGEKQIGADRALIAFDQIDVAG